MLRIFSLLYDRILAGAEKASLSQWRKEILNDLHGDVLEIGAGTGLNLGHYPSSVKKLWLLEPDSNMRRVLRQKMDGFLKARPDLKIEILENFGEKIPLKENSCDAVVGTLVLCSVKDLSRVLGEIYRVLRPGGCYAFIEHIVQDSDSGLFRWQQWIEPLWKRLFGNCHLTRNAEQEIVKAGFLMEWIKMEDMKKSFPLVKRCLRGVSRKISEKV